MAKKKDFSNIAAGKVHDTIAKATAEPDAQEEQKTQGKRKARKTYNEQEAAEFIQAGKTAGRKGLKLQRINLAFQPDVYEYVKTMGNVTGTSATYFINDVLKKHMDENADMYAEALKFRQRTYKG